MHRIRGYRISQLISSLVDAGDILCEYQTTRYADHFFNLKIGIPYADLERRVDMASVLSLRSDASMMDKADDGVSMGVDTGRALHVVILQQDARDKNRQNLIHPGAYREFSDLDELMARYQVSRCVIDGMPETHSPRLFAERHGDRVYLCFFNEAQKGAVKWDWRENKVEVNRTEALRQRNNGLWLHGFYL